MAAELAVRPARQGSERSADWRRLLRGDAAASRLAFELGREPSDAAATFRLLVAANSRYLVAMAAVQVGVLRELRRTARDGRPVVVLLDPRTERLHRMDDPQLGEAEPAAVDAMLRVLGGV
jgi:hypothetical protein